jgi:urea carboxylase
LHGILDLQCGVRSLQVHFDARVLSREFLAEALAVYEDEIASASKFVTPSRVVHLPLCWEADELDDARAVVFEAAYVVLAIGDGPPGDPVAVPLDPRHRLNPPLRIRGAGCFVGLKLAGLTVPLWNTFGMAAESPPGTPWLLRCFDQIRFFPVTAGELAGIRDLFPRGRYPLRIERQSLKVKRQRADAPSRLDRDLPDAIVQPIDFNRPRSV